MLQNRYQTFYNKPTMTPTTIHELIKLLSTILVEHGGGTPIEFQDYDEEERNVDIILENKVNYTDSSESTKKLCIRIV